jgi:hypothetical protein
MQQQTFQAGQNQQFIMQEPPNVVSVKDSHYLTDMLSWNLLSTKKAHFFAGLCQDPEIKNVLEQVGQMHQQHYQRIITHLQNSNQPNPNPMNRTIQ